MVEEQTTGRQSNDDSTVADKQEIERLQDRVTELQRENQELHRRIKIQDEQLQKADELNAEMLELRPKHWLVTEELRVNREQLQLTASEQLRLQNKLTELQQEIDRTHRENQRLQNTVSLQPDYTVLRDRVLERLRMGRQSSAGKTIEAFIRELQKLD